MSLLRVSRLIPTEVKPLENGICTTDSVLNAG